MSRPSRTESLGKRGQVVAHIAKIKQTAVCTRLLIKMMMKETMTIFVMMLSLPVANGSQAVPPLSLRSSLSAARGICSPPPSSFPPFLQARGICSFPLLVFQSQQGNSCPPSQGRAEDQIPLFGNSTHPVRFPVARVPLTSTDAAPGNDELSCQKTCGFPLLVSGLATLQESIETHWRSSEENAPESPAESSGSLLESTGIALLVSIALQLENKMNFLLENFVQLPENSVILQGNTGPLQENTGSQMVLVPERGSSVSLHLESIEPLHQENTALPRLERTAVLMSLESVGLSHLESTGLHHLENSEALLPESTGCLQERIDALLLAQTELQPHQETSWNFLQVKTENLPLQERILLLQRDTGVVQSLGRIGRLLRLLRDSEMDPCSLHRGPQSGSECTRTGCCSSRC